MSKVLAFLFLFVIAFAIAGCVGGVLWPYTINSWLAFIDKPPVVTFWQGFCLGCIPGIGQLCIAGAFLTWAIMLFIGGA